MIIPCTFDAESDPHPASTLITIGDRPVAFACPRHEWEYMFSIRKKVAGFNLLEAERGWQKFCEERGYNPRDNRFHP